MMTKKSSLPFERAVDAKVEAYGISKRDAIQDVQQYYQYFKNRNEQLLSKQNDQANSTQINLLNQCTISVIAALTVGGAFAGSVYKDSSFTDSHKAIFISMLALGFTALVLCLIDYLLTIRFHQRWAKAYHQVDKETNERLDSGSLQWTSDLGHIETKHIDDLPTTTNIQVGRAMVASVIGTLILLLLLISTYFYDLPNL